ncbi:hypothetical protein [Domibacillus tundrae]|uniref:hypothetical protein n=1 Tax=Domibacillus tundrae TaxID=1587527 RepID=UPI003391F5CE
MLLHENLENDQSLRVSKFMILLQERSVLKAFVCFTDDKGQLKSMTYEHGEYHQYSIKEGKVETISEPVFFRTLIRIQKGLYTGRTYGQLRLVNPGKRKKHVNWQ